MTLAEIIRLAQELMDDPKGDRWEKSSLLPLVNAAQATLVNDVNEADEQYFSKFVEYSITAAQNDSLEFTLPADTTKIIQVERLGQGGAAPIPGLQVAFQHRRDFQDDLPYPTARQSPKWYVRKNLIGFVNPRDAYTARVYYLPRLANLDDDSDVSEFPLEHHELLAFHAARIAYGIQERPFPLERMYQEEHSKLLRQVENRKRSAPRYVVPERF